MLALALCLALVPAQDPEVLLVGRVVEADEQPIPSLPVRVDYQGRAKVALTDEEGRFEVGFDLREHPSMASLEFGREGDATVSRSVFLYEPVRYDFGDLVLGPPGSVIVRVVDKAGRIQEQAQVHLDVQSRSFMRRYRFDGASPDPRTGEVRFDAVAAGAYLVSSTVQFDGEIFAAQGEVEVAPGFESVLLLTFDDVLSPLSEVTLYAGGFELLLQPGHVRARDADGREVPFSWIGADRMGDPMGVRLSESARTFEVDHPRFQLAAPVPVVTGRPLHLDLVPRATVVLEPEVTGPSAGRWVVHAHGKDEPKPVLLGLDPLADFSVTHRFEVPPGEWVLEAVVGHGPRRWFPVTLSAGEERRLSLPLGQSVRDVTIPFEVGPGRSDPARARITLSRGPDWLAVREQRRLEVSGGALHLVDLVPEPYVLLLDWGEWLWLEIPFHGAAPPDSFSMPQVGRVEGRLLLDEDVDPERVGLAVDHVVVGLQDDGSFLVPLAGSGPLPYQVLLDHAKVVREGTFEVPVGTLEATLDLRDLAGPMAVDLRLDGSALRGGVLLLLDSNGQVVFDGHPDSAGRVPLVGVSPGTYRAEVQITEGSWIWTAERELVVTPGSAASVRVALTHIDRVVEFRNVAGQPLADVEVGYRDGRGSIRAVRTDGQGRVRLRLPPVVVEFFRKGSVTTRSRAAWAAGAGPLLVTFPER